MVVVTLDSILFFNVFHREDFPCINLEMDGESSEKKKKPTQYEDDDFEDDFEEEDDDSPAKPANKPSSASAGAAASKGSTAGLTEAELAVKRAVEGGMWKEHKDAATGRSYYYHVVTRKTTWDLAAELGFKTTTPSPQGAKSNDGLGLGESKHSFGGDSSVSVASGYSSAHSGVSGIPQLQLPSHVTQGEGGVEKTRDASMFSTASGFAPWAKSGAATPRTEDDDSTPRDDTSPTKILQVKTSSIANPKSSDDGGDSAYVPQVLPQVGGSDKKKELTKKPEELKKLSDDEDGEGDGEGRGGDRKTGDRTQSLGKYKAFNDSSEDGSDFSTASQLLKEVAVAHEAKAEEIKKQELEQKPVLQPLPLPALAGTGTVSPQPQATPATGLLPTTNIGTGLMGTTSQSAIPSSQGTTAAGAGVRSNFTFGSLLNKPLGGGLAPASTTSPTTSAVPAATTTGVSAQTAVATQSATTAASAPTGANYVDPNTASMAQLTAGAEALSQLVRAYKELRQSASPAPAPSIGPDGYDVPPKGQVAYSALDGIDGTRRDGGGGTVQDSDEWLRRRGEARARTARKESQYLQRVAEKENLLEEDLLDLVMTMFLQKQGGPLPQPETPRSGSRPSSRKGASGATVAVGGKAVKVKAESAERYKAYTSAPATQSAKKALTSAPPAVSPAQALSGLFEFDSFAESGSLQRLVEDNLNKYIVTAVKRGTLHPSCTRFILIDIATVLHDLMIYARQAQHDSSNTSGIFGAPLLSGSEMALVCLDGSRMTQRLVDHASRVLHCLPFEVASALQPDNTPSTGAVAGKKLLFRLEHWVSMRHALEVHRGIVNTLREVESTVFDIDIMSMQSGRPHRGSSMSNLSDLDEADLACCISSTVSLFVPSAPKHQKKQQSEAAGNTPSKKRSSEPKSPGGVLKAGSSPSGGHRASATANRVSFGFGEDASESILYAARKAHDAFVEDVSEDDGFDSKLAEECFADTLQELLAEPSIREAVQRRATGKFNTKKAEIAHAQGNRMAASARAKKDTEVQREVEEQVNRVLERIRYEVEHGEG